MTRIFQTAIGGLLLGASLLFLLTLPRATPPTAYRAPRGEAASSSPPTPPTQGRPWPGAFELPRSSQWAKPTPEALVVPPEIQPPATRKILVRVFGPENAVLARAQVDWATEAQVADRNWQPPTDLRWTTDEGGWLLLEDLPPEPLFLLAAPSGRRPPGRVLIGIERVGAPGVSASPGKPEEPEEIEILVESQVWRKIVGRVLASDGEPVIGLSLDLVPTVRNSGKESLLQRLLEEGLVLEKSGHFHLRLIGDETWELLVRADLGVGDRPLARRSLGPGDEERPVEIFLPDAPMIDCRLFEASGAPLPFSRYSLFWSAGNAGGGGIGFSSSHGSQTTARFLWPRRATEVTVRLSSRGGESSELLLRSPLEPCAIYRSP